MSSGAIAAGLSPLGLRKRPRGLAAQQAAASVGQGLLVHRYTEELARHGITTGQVLLTLDDVTRRSHHQNAYRTFARLLEMGVLPIVNENDTVATTEIRFGDNDRLAALVAHLVHADALLLLTDVDGLYDRAPSDPAARRIERVRTPADLAGVSLGRSGSRIGTGGMVTKVEAASIATTGGVATVLTSADLAAAALGGGGERKGPERGAERGQGGRHPGQGRRAGEVLGQQRADRDRGADSDPADHLRGRQHDQGAGLDRRLGGGAGAGSAGCGQHENDSW